MKRDWPRLHPLLTGAVLGAWLCFARAPGGPWPWAVGSSGADRSALFRGAALLGAAWLLLAARSAQRHVASSTYLLLGALAGFAYQALLAAPWVAPSGAFDLLVAWLIALLLVRLLARRLAHAMDGPAASRERDFRPLETVGLATLGAGLALCTEASCRPLRAVIGIPPHDGLVFACAGLAWAALGAAAFSGAARALLGRAALPAFGGAACAGGLVTLSLTAGLSTRDSLDAFLRHGRWDLDLSHQGMLGAELLIGGRCLLPLALPLGIALGATRERWRWFALLVGAAAATLSMPRALDHFARSLADAAAEGSVAEALGRVPFERVRAFAWLGAGGALLACLAWRGEALRRGIAAALLLASIVLVGRSSVVRSAIFSPWERFEPVHYFGSDEALGVLTVETAPGGALCATLDGARLTPVGTDALDDAACQRQSWSARQRSTVEGSQRRGVLFVGQLTPERAQLWRELGVERIDRTASWWKTMPELERALFAPQAAPPGDILEPGALDAERLASYELIYVAPMEDPAFAPDPAQLARLGAIAWLRASSGAAARRLGERVRVASASLSELWIGIGAVDASGLLAGARRSAPVPGKVLAQRTYKRQFAAALAATARLCDANRGTEQEHLAQGLASLHELQAHSSPFETRAQQIELDEATLGSLRDAALSPSPDPCLPELVAALARVLAEKREVDWIYTYMEPIAAAHPTWTDVQRALTSADFETLDFERASARLEALRLSEPNDLSLLLELARAASLSLDHARAVEVLREAQRIQPGRRDVERRLALARLRAGDAGAKSAIEELLFEDPDDEHLRQFLGAGPYPDVALDFAQHQGAHEGAHAH